MRQAEVQSLFLQNFDRNYPQFRFRGLRRFTTHALSPYSFALRVGYGKSNLELDLLCVTLTDGFPQDVERFAQRVRESEIPYSEVPALPVFVAPLMEPPAQELCRREGIGYFDLAGNAGLETDRLYIRIEGRGNPGTRKRQMESPFHGKAERVVRRLLIEPNRRWSMRALATAAEVSLGMASMTTSLLADLSLVHKGRGGTDLFDAKSLLDQWSHTYDLRRNAFRIYRSHAHVNELEARLVAQEEQIARRYAMTLWSGAHRLFDEEHPRSRLAIYWLGTPEELARRLRLSEDAGSTYVFVFQPYDECLLWGKRETARGLLVVHPLQLYLDLASGDDEELALAQRVREQLLVW